MALGIQNVSLEKDILIWYFWFVSLWKLRAERWKLRSTTVIENIGKICYYEKDFVINLNSSYWLFIIVKEFRVQVSSPLHLDCVDTDSKNYPPKFLKSNKVNILEMILQSREKGYVEIICLGLWKLLLYHDSEEWLGGLWNIYTVHVCVYTIHLQTPYAICLPPLKRALQNWSYLCICLFPVTFSVSSASGPISFLSVYNNHSTAKDTWTITHSLPRLKLLLKWMAMSLLSILRIYKIKFNRSACQFWSVGTWPVIHRPSPILPSQRSSFSSPFF